MITLGYTVKDMITGFKGVAIAKLEGLFSARQIHVQSRGMENGVPVPPQWFEEGRLIPDDDDKPVGFAP